MYAYSLSLSITGWWIVSGQVSRKVYPGILATKSILDLRTVHVSGYPGSKGYPGIWAINDIRAIHPYPGNSVYPGKQHMF